MTALAAAILIASWVAAWLMPAPRLCKSMVGCPRFNEDAVMVGPFWLNWQQLLVLVLGLASFGFLLTLSFRRARR